MMRSGSRVDALVPGLVAWWTGVAGPVFSGPSPLASRASSLLAAPAVVAGTLLLRRWPRVGRALGVGAFVALSTLAWLAAPAGLLARQLDPAVAAIAVVAWTAFAMGWGVLELAVTTDEARPDTAGPEGDVSPGAGSAPSRGSARVLGVPLLAPRHLGVGWMTTVAVIAVVAGALGLVVSALPIVERERGVFAQVTAGASAIAVVAVLAKVVRPASRAASNRQVSTRAGQTPPRVTVSVLLCIVLGLGLLVVLWSHSR